MISNFSNISKCKLSVLSGIIIGLSYPPSPFGFLAWFGLIPLIHVLFSSSIGDSVKWSFVTGLIVNVITVYWFGLNSGAGVVPALISMVAAILYLSIFWILFGFLSSWYNKITGHGLSLVPLIWVFTEFLRGFGPLSFPWINLALTQTFCLPLVQIADVTGSMGISFWIVLLNVIIYTAIRSKNVEIKILYMGGLLILVIYLLGYFRISSIENREINNVIKTAIVQPNIDPNLKWEQNFRHIIFNTMDSLHNEAIKLEPDLILWPEAALPTYLRINYSNRKSILQKVKKSNIPLLTGTPDRIKGKDNKIDYYNASMFLKPDGSTKMYYKIHLVPFAESIPFSNYFSFLKKLNFGQANFTAGSEYTIFNLDGISFANLICYESSIPKIARKFINLGANFITIETNDSWCGHSSGVYQHFEIAKLRAVENRVPIARSANTGISGLILPTGKVNNKIPFNEQKVTLSSIPIKNVQSFYTKYGDWFAVICTLISLITLFFGWLQKRS